MRTVIPCAILLVAVSVAPATAGALWHKAHVAGVGVGVGGWRAIRDAIYERENRIAYLEADPDADDGYKAPIIAKARAEIRRLQAMLGRPQWRWTTPCCYSRRTLYIR